MSITSDLEDKGFDIDKLNPSEKETYFAMLDQVKQTQLTPEKLKDYIVSMREAVTKELINEPEFIRIFIFKFENRKQMVLKARLQNYTLLEAFLDSPKKAKEMLDNMVANIGRKVS